MFQRLGYNTPVRGVNHDWYFGYVWVRTRQMQELRHTLLGVKHGVSHADIYHLCSALNLTACHKQRLVKITFRYKTRKLFGASHICTLSNIYKVIKIAWFKTTKACGRLNLRNFVRRIVMSHAAQQSYMLRGGAAASTHNIKQTLLKEWFHSLSHTFWSLRVYTLFIGETRIRVCAYMKRRYLRKRFNVRQHVSRAK